MGARSLRLRERDAASCDLERIGKMGIEDPLLLLLPFRSCWVICILSNELWSESDMLRGVCFF